MCYFGENADHTNENAPSEIVLEIVDRQHFLSAIVGQDMRWWRNNPIIRVFICPFIVFSREGSNYLPN